jgi:tRNA A-37 threonylcarbamoyl transferase component Bud32
VAYTFKHGDRPIDGITVQRAIGRGGFGEVYYALTDSGKQVAVKYLRDNPDVELRGIAHVMNLKSPYLITIYDVRHSEAGDPHVIMEYVSGPSLRDLLIAEPNGLGPQKAAFFLGGIAKGLSYLHERGIVHRDLKPGNIFYDDGYVKIGDYGLSKHIAVSAHSGNTISVGTVHYMAPEIGSGSYTKSIDIYALGVMLYEMLTGRLPFTGSSMGEVLMRHLSEQPDVSGIPEPFAGVIAKALAKDPQDRYQDVDEMVEAVTSATEVSASLESFDASVLTQAPRSEGAADVDRTRTTPPRVPPAPVLDARVADIGLPPIPPIPPVLDRKAAKKAHKLQKKARKLQAKAEKKAQVVQAKLAGLGLGPGAREAAKPAVPVAGGRWRSLVIALIVLFAVSGGLGIAYNCSVVFGASLLYLFGGTLGTLLGFGLSGRRGSLQRSFYDRLVYAACGFVFMLPGFAAGFTVNDAFARLIIPLTATLFIFDWTERIQLGRRRIIEGGCVLWHGLLAAILAAIFTDGRYAFVGGVLAAALLIIVQSAVAVRPLVAAATVRAAGPQPRKAPKVGAWERVEGVFERASTAIERAGQRLESAVERGKAKAVDANSDAQGAEQTTTPGAAGQQGKADGPKQPAQPAAAMDFYQPSFVGRTANAGLSFLAKLLLLAGLAVALLFTAELINFDSHGTRFIAGAGQVRIEDRGRVEFQQTIPQAAVFVPLLFGSILLIVARRNDGAAHFVRGFFGCVLASVAAIFAVGPAAPEVALFFKGDWDTLMSNEGHIALIVVGAFLVGAFLLLFWPKPMRRGEKPLVI